jgi:hypothetical protein
MYTILTGEDTPPPLTLALNVLKHMTADTHGGYQPPINIGIGNTNVLDLTRLFGQTITKQQESQIVPLLTLAGQMLYRYIPSLLELDERTAYGNIRKRNLTTVLPGGKNYTTLRNVGLLATTKGPIRRSGSMASRQRNSSAIIPRGTIVHPQHDYRVLSDYTVIRQRLQHRNLKKASIFQRFGALKNDIARNERPAMKRDVATAQRILNQKMHLTSYPGIPRIPPLIPATSSIIPDDYSLGTPLDILTRIGDLESTKPVQFDACNEDHNPFLVDGSTKNGTFYESNIVNAVLEPLDGDLFGQVDVSGKPFQITINSRMAYPRVQLSFIHELLHVMTEMQKINIPHHAIHELAFLIMDEVLPGLEALARFTHQKL